MAKTLFNISNKIVAGNAPGELLAYRDRIIADGGTLETFAETEAEIRRLQSLGLYDSLSLGYIAGGYKASKWYNIKGATGDLAVTRATNGTRQNRAGAIDTLGNNLTRADFEDGVLKGNWVESAATNGFTGYELSAGGFASRVVNNELSATNFMYTHVENTADSSRSRTGTLAEQSTPYVISVIYKNLPSNRYIKLFGARTGVGSSFAGATFGHDGTVLAQTVTGTARVTNLGKGYFLAEVTVTPTDTSTRDVFCRVTNDDSTGISAGNVFVGTGETYIIGAHQVELGTVASTRIFVNGATATRNADNISKTGIAIEIGQTEGVIYTEVDVSKDLKDNADMFNLSDGTTNNRVLMNINDTNIRVIIRGSSGTQLFDNPTTNITGVNRYALQYSTTNYKLYRNGTLIKSFDFTTGAFTLNQLHVGSRAGSTNYFNDRQKALYHWKTAKTDAELIALTTL